MLSRLGAEIYGFALAPNTKPSMFASLGLEDLCASSVFSDIRNLDALKRAFADARPDIVIHMAAQPIVSEGYRDPIGTFDTNVMGTIHLLEVCRSMAAGQVLVVSSDKCYRNDELGRPFTENDPLGGKDPYSASKAGTEIAAETYRSSFFGDDDSPLIASGRAGNVIGGGDWSIDRLFPDAARAFAQGQQLIVRNPDSVRPWQHVLEPVCGYLLLVEKLANDPNLAKGWNFGPIPSEGTTVRRVVDMAVVAWGADATWTTPDTVQSFGESKLLTLDCTAADTAFGWRSVLSIEQTIKWTMQWYRKYEEFGPKATRALTTDQIEDYFLLQKRSSS